MPLPISFNFIEVECTLENEATFNLLYSFDEDTNCEELFTHIKRDINDFYPEDDSDQEDEKLFKITHTDNDGTVFIINSKENLKAVICKYFYTKNESTVIYLKVNSLRNQNFFAKMISGGN